MHVQSRTTCPADTSSMSTDTLKVAIVGLGRMGKRHALHFQNLTPRATLIAAATIEPEELKWAEKELPSVRTYLSFDKMLESEPDIQAVVVSSATAVHAEQAIKAIQLGLHVLCEKPLSTSPETVRATVLMATLL